MNTYQMITQLIDDLTKLQQNGSFEYRARLYCAVQALKAIRNYF